MFISLLFMGHAFKQIFHLLSHFIFCRIQVFFLLHNMSLKMTLGHLPSSICSLIFRYLMSHTIAIASIEVAPISLNMISYGTTLLISNLFVIKRFWVFSICFNCKSEVLLAILHNHREQPRSLKAPKAFVWSSNPIHLPPCIYFEKHKTSILKSRKHFLTSQTHKHIKHYHIDHH